MLKTNFVLLIEHHYQLGTTLETEPLLLKRKKGKRKKAKRGQNQEKMKRVGTAACILLSLRRALSFFGGSHVAIERCWDETEYILTPFMEVDFKSPPWYAMLLASSHEPRAKSKPPETTKLDWVSVTCLCTQRELGEPGEQVTTSQRWRRLYVGAAVAFIWVPAPYSQGWVGVLIRCCLSLVFGYRDNRAPGPEVGIVQRPAGRPGKFRGLSYGLILPNNWPIYKKVIGSVFSWILIWN